MENARKQMPKIRGEDCIFLGRQRGLLLETERS
jgi:hypothetical protein